MERAHHPDNLGSLILVRPDRVGDVIISSACFAPIKQHFPQLKLYFVAAERMRPLFDSHPLLEKFISLDSDLDHEFGSSNAQAVVHLHPDERCYAIAAEARIPLRIGYTANGWERHLTQATVDHRRDGLKHEAEYNFDLLRLLGMNSPKELSASILLSETPEVLRKIPEPFHERDLVMIHAGAHSPYARWPRERFAAVAKILESQLKILPVFVGAERDEWNEAKSFEHLNLTGQTDLGELGSLLCSAKLLISNDSGPGHLAAAVGCPVVSLFGRTAPIYGPTRWRPLTPKSTVLIKPLGRRWFERKESHWRRSFAAITVPEVIGAAKLWLSANP